MLRDFRPESIKHTLAEAVAALGRLAVATMQDGFVQDVFNLVRIDCHDFFFVRYLVKLFSTGPVALQY